MKYVMTFIVGALAGAAVALLYTPIKGKKMQKKLTKLTDRVVDRVADKVDEFTIAARKMAS